jgi:hypothetical protein
LERYEHQSTFERKKRQVGNFIQGCIETVEARGIEKEKKIFLSKLDPRLFVSVTIFILGVIGTVCYQRGKYNSDIQNIKLDEKIGKKSDTMSKQRKLNIDYEWQIDSLQKRS